MRAFVLLWVFLLCLVACQDLNPGQPGPSGTSYKTVIPGQSRTFYAAGTSGTYTVPSGAYVTSFSCHASAAGATLVMTMTGPGITTFDAGPSIVIPAGGAYGLEQPTLPPTALGAGAKLVFTGTDSYAITLYQAS